MLCPMQRANQVAHNLARYALILNSFEAWNLNEIFIFEKKNSLVFNGSGLVWVLHFLGYLWIFKIKYFSNEDLL